MTAMKTMEMAMKKALAKQVKEAFAKQEAEVKKPCVYDAKLVTISVGEITIVAPEPLRVRVNGYIEIWLI